ncbi:XrtA/PEP-CTERM system histidine kinase PrsK [Novosphingobium sp.]|uniref:XrtA/PEP-CTERM system histidine kinase PrsK n=1 Tax=Novosphingobium sp. TaxID=1874826 RepID=UPI0035B29919
MQGLSGIWSVLGVLAWSAGTLACALSALWLESRRERYGTARHAVGAALAMTALWGLAGLVIGVANPLLELAEAGRNLAWIFALYRLFAVDGRHASMRPIRPMIAALAFVELLQIATQAAFANIANAQVTDSVFHTAMMLHLLVTTGGLVLVHNLYGGASTQGRLVLRWPALALAALWGYDLNYYTIAYLADDNPGALAALRGLVGLGVGGLLAFGAAKGSEHLRFRPSRSVAFQSASLLLIGGYLIAMVGVAQWLNFAGGDFSQLAQIAFIALASATSVMILPSRRLRGLLKVVLTKHLFQHRYDYRAEWLRFTRTIGRSGGDAGASLEERVIRAVADIADSPAGLLLTPGEGGQLELAARWQWPTAEVPGEAFDLASVRALEASGYITDLDQLRAGKALNVPNFMLPAWLIAEPRAWALVPLLHFERLVGLVVLARPAQTRALDWEDFDLLRVAGQQLASYLAENAGQEALAEAARFDDFHRRIAFVMHDIKNLASQLSLLSRNAELHAENPAFRADMLVTLRNSTDKLNAMLARLSRYGPTSVEALEPVRADEVAAAIAAQFKGRHDVVVVETQPCTVSAKRESLEQVLLHLVQNAVDASDAALPVFLRVTVDGLNGVIEVVDSGTGMSAEFVRNRLFRPFDSTKSGGFGIGAYEARELVRAMNGRLDVESREGLGSRFAIRLPLAEAAQLLETYSSKTAKTGKKVA